MLRYITRKKVAHKEPGPSIHLKKQGQRTRGAGRELIGWRDEANKVGTRVDETQVREHENLICITQNHNPKNDGLQSGQYDSLRPQNDGGRSLRGGIASPGQTDRRTPVCPPTVSPGVASWNCQGRRLQALFIISNISFQLFPKH